MYPVINLSGFFSGQVDMLSVREPIVNIFNSSTADKYAEIGKSGKPAERHVTGSIIFVHQKHSR